MQSLSQPEELSRFNILRSLGCDSRSPPPMRIQNINCDASRVDWTQRVGIAVVCRDNYGRVMDGVCSKVLQVEAIAIRDSVIMTFSTNYDNVIIETDSATLTSCLNGLQLSMPWEMYSCIFIKIPRSANIVTNWLHFFPHDWIFNPPDPRLIRLRKDSFVSSKCLMEIQQR